jgi:hypothetical protein
MIAIPGTKKAHPKYLGRDIAALDKVEQGRTELGDVLFHADAAVNLAVTHTPTSPGRLATDVR